MIYCWCFGHTDVICHANRATLFWKELCLPEAGILLIAQINFHIDYSCLIAHMETADIKQTVSSLRSHTAPALSAQCAVCVVADQISLCFPSYSNKAIAARQPSHITSYQARNKEEEGGRKLCWQDYISQQPSPRSHINVVRHSEVMSISHMWQGRWRRHIQQWF